MLIGIVGKPSAGKTTFINAACMTSYKTADYPFTTIEPQPGVAYVRVDCVCKDFGVQDNPKNSICIDGIRFVPINLLDVAGLVPDAWKGRGRGNKFLDDLRRADALIHVVDFTGSLDAEGRPIEPGSRDPLEDIKFLEKEITMWMLGIVKSDWRRITGRVKSNREDFSKLLEVRLSGLAINRYHIKSAINLAKLDDSRVAQWTEDDIYIFVDTLRKVSKPIIIAANKIDSPIAQKNFERLSRELKDLTIIPTTALGEYLLKTLAKKGQIRYIPGDNTFEIIDTQGLSEKIIQKLDLLKEKVLDKYGSTGVQKVLEETVFNVLEMICVFPVEDVNKLTDHHGNVLPDAFLIKKGTTAREFAYKIHTSLGETFIHAIDARTKRRLSENYILQHRDVIKIVSAKGE
ncbi:MAG: redox-regulated ATPase YchF [Candidatus Asgardarchaeia archaeon]